MKRRVLVTGGAGHLGSTLVDALLAKGSDDVLVIDDLSTGYLGHIPAGAEFIQADVNDADAFRRAVGERHFDLIFHYAALVGVDETLARPWDVLRDLEGLRNVLGLAAERQPTRIFFISSSEVYPPDAPLPLAEELSLSAPPLPYAYVKLAGEGMLQELRRTCGLRYTIVRAFNTYGFRQRSDFVIARFLRAALEGRDLVVFGEGCQTRTFLHVDDHVEGVLRCLDEGRSIDATINLGSDVEVTMLALARTIVRLTGSRSRIVWGPARELGDVRRRRPDVSRMKNWLGISPRSLEAGLEDLIERVSGGERLSLIG